MGDWTQVIWLLMALILVAPAGWRILRHDRNVLTYIALWLGIALMLSWVYVALDVVIDNGEIRFRALGDHPAPSQDPIQTEQQI